MCLWLILFFYYEDRNTFKDVQGVAGIIIEKIQ